MSIASTDRLVFSEEKIAQYVASIQRDFYIARCHQQNGQYELIVTPESYVLRMAKMAVTRADIDGYGSSQAELLIKLYNDNCPGNVKVEAYVQKTLPLLSNGLDKDVYTLCVCFTHLSKHRHPFRGRNA